MATASYGAGNVGWTREPTTRGTTSLVLNCVSTILICTWSALHLHVPHDEHSTWSLFVRKLGFLTVALVAPEWITMCAYRDWEEARELTKQMRARAASEHAQAMEHQYRLPWSSSQSFFLVMQGVVVRPCSNPRLDFVLYPDKVLWMLQRSYIDEKDIDAQAIEDKSKANSFNKAIASVQIAWFLSQLLGRAAAHLPITLLEFFTLAYLVCAVAAYAFWWHKPFDIQYPIIVQGTEALKYTEAIECRQPLDRWERFLRVYTLEDSLFGGPKERRGVFVFLITCLLFGACHLLGWNAYFPTLAEMVLWRTGSICCIALPLLFCSVPGVVYGGTGFDGGNMIQRLFTIFKVYAGFIMVCLYTLVRAFLFFEAFFSLRTVPAGVYRAVPWAQYMPHI